jgi:hypothetical protein
VTGFLAGAAFALLVVGGLAAWGAWRLYRWLRSVGEMLLAASETAGTRVRTPAPGPSPEAEKLRRHDTNSARCWCGPELRCLDCDEPGPCIHGTGRSLLVLHRQAS